MAPSFFGAPMLTLPPPPAEAPAAPEIPQKIEILDPVAALVDQGKAVLFDRNRMVHIKGGYGEWITSLFPRLFFYHHLETNNYIVAMWVMDVPDRDPHNYPMIELELLSGNPARPSYEGWCPSYDYLKERIKGQTESVKHSIRQALAQEKVRTDRELRRNEKVKDLTGFLKRRGMEETAAKIGAGQIPISPDDPKDFESFQS